jgi:hypothetical protein
VFTARYALIPHMITFRPACVTNSESGIKGVQRWQAMRGRTNGVLLAGKTKLH